MREAKLTKRTGMGAGTTELTEDDILRLRKADAWTTAEIYDARLREMERQHRRSFVEMGMICLEVSDQELWKKLIVPDYYDDEGLLHTGEYFHSFDAWMLSAAGVSRSSAYSAMKTVKELKDVPMDEVRAMPRCNAVVLAGLSSEVRQQPEMREAAKVMTEEAFIAEIQTRHPNEHRERRQALPLKPERSQRTAILYAIDVALWALGTVTREEAQEAMCAAWMDSPCEVEGYTQMSNREAYLRVQQEAAA